MLVRARQRRCVALVAALGRPRGIDIARQWIDFRPAAAELPPRSGAAA